MSHAFPRLPDGTVAPALCAYYDSVRPCPYILVYNGQAVYKAKNRGKFVHAYIISRNRLGIKDLSLNKDEPLWIFQKQEWMWCHLKVTETPPKKHTPPHLEAQPNNVASAQHLDARSGVEASSHPAFYAADATPYDSGLSSAETSPQHDEPLDDSQTDHSRPQSLARCVREGDRSIRPEPQSVSADEHEPPRPRSIEDGDSLESPEIGDPRGTKGESSDLPETLQDNTKPTIEQTAQRRRAPWERLSKRPRPS